MNQLTDIVIKKSSVESALSTSSLVDSVNKNNQDRYVVNVIDEKSGKVAILNIYFKKTGKVSFLAQGQSPDVATALAVSIIESIK